jgi:hypothetical protein
MLKDRMSKSTIDTTEPIRDGRYSILTRRQRLKPRGSMKNSASISTDHSTLDQDFQCRELLSATEPIMSGSEDGERMLWVNNGTLMKSPRLSRVNSGSLTHLIFKETEPQPILDAQILTQDGGNCSNLMELSLETSRSIKCWMSQVELMEKTETS